MMITLLLLGGLIGLGKLQSNFFISALGILSGLACLVAFPLYYILFPLSRLHATPGQMLFGLYIAPDSSKKPVTKKDFIFRGIIKILSQFFVYIFLVALFTKHKRALHDFVGHTRVVQPIYQQVS